MIPVDGEITSVDRGIVTIAIRTKEPFAARPYAVLLDGVFAGSVVIGPGARNRRASAGFRLPMHFLPATLDVIDNETGASILAHPYEFGEIFRIDVERFVLDGHVVSGRFRLDHPLDPILPVLLQAEDHPPIVAYAHRTPDQGNILYEFGVPLRQLIELDRSYTLGLEIAGHALPAGPQLTVDAASIGYVGYVDRWGNGEVSGWAADLSDRTRRLKIDLLRDGAVVDSMVAEVPRADLERAGISGGRSAFRFVLPKIAPGEPDVAYGVVLSGTTTHLCNSPVTLSATSRLLGFFDEIEGGIAVGWLANLDDPKTPLEVEVICGGSVLARAMANGFRGDVLHAGIPISNCGFRINLGAAFRTNLGREVSVRPVGTTTALNGSPKLLRENPNIGRFFARTTRLNEAALRRLKQRISRRVGNHTISIIMPVYNTRQEWLLEALESVRQQWCDNWELVCIDDHSTEPHVARILTAYARHDPRFRILTSPENVGIARATNFGIRAARHDYITFMDHDDYLEPDAIYALLRAIEASGSDFLYSDEVLTYEDLSSILEVRARPTFSYDYYLSHPYFVHMLCVRTEVARQVGGWDETLPISADIDFVLRVLEVANAVAHVPAVLYRWRTHEGSTGHTKQAQVMEASKTARRRHFDRRGILADVNDGVFFNQFRIDWPSDTGEILIVIPTKNKADLLKTCIDSIERTSKGINYRIVVIDHESDEPASMRYLKRLASRHTVLPYKGSFNFARINNIAVQKDGDGAKYLLFLNNDIEAIDDGWLDRMRSLANRPEVGAVGPLLMYGDKRVQHAGVIIGFNNAAEHAMKFADAYIDGGEKRNLGYNCTLSSTRDFSAVTAACLMIRRDVFERVGGFDEIFAIGFNDTDLCLRLIKAGYKNLYDGCTMLFHHESATRSETSQVIHPEDDNLLRTRWRRYFVEGDPFYNPALDIRMNDHALRTDKACKVLAAPRVTKLVGLPEVS